MINIADCTHREVAEKWATFFLGCAVVDKTTVNALCYGALENHKKNEVDPEHDECGFPVPNSFTREHMAKLRRLLIQCINKAVVESKRNSSPLCLGE